MAVRLTQPMVERASTEEKPGTQLVDADVSGLRVVVGKNSSSYKLVGRIKDGTDRYVSIIVGRIDGLSLKKARAHATELRLALGRGEDPKKPKGAVPTLGEAFAKYMDARRNEITQG